MHELLLFYALRISFLPCLKHKTLEGNENESLCLNLESQNCALVKKGLDCDIESESMCANLCVFLTFTNTCVSMYVRTFTLHICLYPCTMYICYSECEFLVNMYKNR